VIDLRENPGGYLKEAINILSQLFQEKGELLVYTEGEHAKRMEYHTSGKPFYKVDNIAVLIDGGSASASEIIAGAIQDHDRGVILGTKSYGKGLVQEQFSLRNGGALRLTVARYYTPSGRCIQKPYSGGVNAYNGSSENGDSVSYKTTNGRIVMADGGIDPDIVVPAKYDWYSGEAYLSYGQLLEYMFYGFDDPYEDKYEDMDEYLEAIPRSDEMIVDFAGFIELDRSDVDWNAFEADWERAYTMIRAMACSYRYGYEAWYKVMNMDDPVVAKAIEVVQEDMRTTLKY
jgi:carboxyl-terminal processing protease